MIGSSNKEKPTGMDRGKKVYHSPELVVYGNVRELTRSIGTMGNSDGVGPPNQKTQP